MKKFCKFTANSGVKWGEIDNTLIYLWSNSVSTSFICVIYVQLEQKIKIESKINPQVCYEKLSLDQDLKVDSESRRAVK